MLRQKIVEEIADHELPEQSDEKKDNCPRLGFCQHSPECAGLPFQQRIDFGSNNTTHNTHQWRENSASEKEQSD